MAKRMVPKQPLLTEYTEHETRDYVLTAEIRALMAQDPAQAFARLVAGLDGAHDHTGRRLTLGEVRVYVASIFRLHGVPVPPEEDDVARILDALVALGFIEVVGATPKGDPLYRTNVEKWDAAGGPDAVSELVDQYRDAEETAP